MKSFFFFSEHKPTNFQDVYGNAQQQGNILQDASEGIIEFVYLRT